MALTLRTLNLALAASSLIVFLCTGASVARAHTVAVTNEDIAQALKHFKGVAVSAEDLSALQSWHAQHQEAPLYADLGWLRASQNRLSYDRVRTKADEVFESKKIQWNGHEVNGALPNQKGKSLFSKDEAIPVVIMPDGSLAIVDGHHEVGVALLSGSSKMPIKIVEDLSKKFATNAEAWKHLESRSLAYFSNLDGTFSQQPVDYSELQNDPNRMWLSITARRVELEVVGAGKARLDSKMSVFDLWVKAGKGIPFIEFMLADILYKHNLVYRADMTPRELHHLLEKSRETFAAEIKNGNPIFAHLSFIATAVNKNEIGNDPNLMLAKLITGSLKTKEITWRKAEGDNLIAVTTKKEHEAAWAEIAFLLYQGGVVYGQSPSGTLAPELLERIRKLLIAAKKESAQPGAITCDFSVIKKPLLAKEVVAKNSSKLAIKRKIACKAHLLI